MRRRAVPTWGVFLDEEKQGGGPLIDIGTHALDLTLWLMDNYKPKMVVGTTYHKLSQRENAANAFGPWDPKKFTVEDSAFGFITMQNGATITLEASWALNTLQVDEAKCTLCGTEGGADMMGGLRINGENFSRLYETKVDLSAGGVAFYRGQDARATPTARRGCGSRPSSTTRPGRPAGAGAGRLADSGSDLQVGQDRQSRLLRPIVIVVVLYSCPSSKVV